MSKINVLIVDDSAFMRKSLSIMLESDPDIIIVGTARNGEEGVKLARELKPDIITMDIEMPVMNGLQALEQIMKYCPTPVIMVSSLTSEGAQATLKAFELGAVDFIPKELSYINVSIIKIKEDLINKCKQIVSQRKFLKKKYTLPTTTPTEKKIQKLLPIKHYKAIGIGVSTGGPISLQKVIPALSANISCPIFVVQHMPAKFTRSLADRLNGLSNLMVKEAEDGEFIKQGTVYIAPGGFHMLIRNCMISITPFPSETLHRPSVDVTLKSVSENYGRDVIGVIMTGMGRDGTEGIKEIKGRGGFAVVQDEESCIVYGMPKSVVESGMADVVGNLEELPIIINKAFGL